MPYSAIAFISILIFASVHLFAAKIRRLNVKTQGIFLSAGGGIALAYVFVDLLPKLCKSNLVVQKALSGFFPYFERHVYILALIGFLLFFIVDKTQLILPKKQAFWFPFIAYAIFNFFVGYAVVDKDDPDVQPLALFTFAITLHYFVNDYSLNRNHGQTYQQIGKWILILSLFLGWFTGISVTLLEPAIALIGAFIAGGVMMNVIRHELPKTNPNSLATFLVSAFIYTIILLAIGN
jgi:hypothetical protein